VLVVDSSAVIAALASQRRHPSLRDRLATDGDLHAPHLLDVEVTHALRRLVLAGALTGTEASALRGDLRALALTRYGHLGLLDRAWALRENLSAYDAVYVALSEALDVPLVTADARLARAPGHRASIELFTR